MKNIYLCGPTVYNTPHIGNMRPIVTFDIFIRSLNALGIKTNLIHNLTDIDDKIIARAKTEGVSESEISEEYISEYRELLINYNINSPDSMPKVTENISNIIEYIESMIKSGNAYELNGDILFSVESFGEYGNVSNRSLDQMRFSESDKRHPGDFALWKKTDEGIQFDSPWGKGRPGWHTECAAFINREMNGESLDIHGGGIDLLFPHHENEAAQYKAVSGNDITKEWKHIGHISIDGDKMSKSLGNDLSAITFAEEVGPDVLRMLFLTTSPTGPINLTDEDLKQVTDLTNKWTSSFLKAQLYETQKAEVSNIAKLISEWKFAEANKVISEEVKKFNKTKENATTIIGIMKLIGFNFSKIEISNEVKEMYFKWEKLRESANYNEADSLRNKLSKYGLI